MGSPTWEALPGKPGLVQYWAILSQIYDLTEKTSQGMPVSLFSQSLWQNIFLGSNTRYMTTESNTHTCAHMSEC